LLFGDLGFTGLLRSICRWISPLLPKGVENEKN
jgi:hypothetical protein